MAKMGRPKKDEPYSRIVNVRFTEKQYKLVKEMSEKAEKERSVFIRNIVLLKIMQ